MQLARTEIDYKELNDLTELMVRASDPEQAINEVLHKSGSELIKEGIQRILPSSGKNWSGKKSPASTSQPFTQENENLSVTVKTKPTYHYLYFPDDGSNTKHHQGNQQFMLRGAQSRQTQIVDEITEELIEQIEGGR